MIIRLKILRKCKLLKYYLVFVKKCIIFTKQIQHCYMNIKNYSNIINQSKRLLVCKLATHTHTHTHTHSISRTQIVTIKKIYDGIEKTVLDSGLNSSGFVINKTYFQGVEDEVEWTFSVMDRDRKTASTSIKVIKDPNSEFGGIYYYPNVKLGYQNNTEIGHFFNPTNGDIFTTDSAKLFQEVIDVLVYFNYSSNYGELEPSPTFSSPGEDANGNAELYDDFYPSLLEWNTRNYTKWDIRADNGVTDELFNNAQNDSLLIVSYDDVWGKKKYKWSYVGLFIPFETASGKKGIVKVLDADFDDTGTISFAMKIQM